MLYEKKVSQVLLGFYAVIRLQVVMITESVNNPCSVLLCLTVSSATTCTL